MYAQLCKGKTVILYDTIVNDGKELHLEFEVDFNGDTLDLGKWVLREGTTRIV
jgi:hypothetical protein